MTTKSLWGRPSDEDDEREDDVFTTVRPAEEDPRSRPSDPAGTQPKFDPKELRPRTREPLLPPARPAIDTDFYEEPVAARLPAHRGGGGAPPSAPVGAVSAGGPLPHAPRFQFALGALIAVALAGLVAAAIILVRGGDTKEQAQAVGNWSAWQPTGTDEQGAKQIAEHVGKEYRLEDGEQLVAVTGGPMQIASLPLYPALRNTAGDIELVEGKGVLFRLCGLGPKCAIPTGEASSERHLLLRREALELALYSFQYLGTDYAVVFLPPRVGEDPGQAVYIPRKDVQGALDKPLDATLYKRTPTIANVTQSPDAPFVQTLTTRQLFDVEGFTQGNQDDRAFLVLQPHGG